MQIAKLGESKPDREQPQAALKRKAKPRPSRKGERAPTQPAPEPPPDTGHIDVVA